MPRICDLEVAHVVENNQGLGPAAVVVADGEEDALSDNGGEKLFNEEGEQDGANGRQVEVVDEEEGLQLESLTSSHQLPSSKDYNVVYNDEDRGLLEGRHGSLAGDELEIVSRVPGDELKGLVEDGP